VTLATYREIRDRIYALARQHGLRPDWVEQGRTSRLLLIYDTEQTVVGRALVPVRDIRASAIQKLQHDLEHLFGKDWLE
jgi:hypothetical protein